MLSFRIRHLVAPILLLALSTACSTIDGGGTGSGAPGGTGFDPGPWSADDTAGPPQGPEEYDYCLPGPEGAEGFMGWQITCTAASATRAFVNPLDDTFVEFEDFSGPFGNICCGGVSAVEEADMDCQTLCMAQVCEAARAQHVAWAREVSSDGMGSNCLDALDDCGFDFDLCVTGALHEQAGQPGNLFTYFLQAECEAVHDDGVSPYDFENMEWSWVESPNDPTNDTAPLCAPLPEPEPLPPEGSPENVVDEAPGTSITLRWALGGGESTSERLLGADVDLAYSIDPCASGDCLGLSRLTVTVPDGTVSGLQLAGMHLSLEAARTPVQPSGAFYFGPDALRATLSVRVNGIPLVITGYNQGTASGAAVPWADTMTLTNLSFGFDDGMFAAALELDISGVYAQRGPKAAIKVVGAPTECELPVTFEAVSADLDDDPLTHVWWVPPWFLGTGELLDATLSPGTHSIYLTSVDSTGQADSTALRFERGCQ